MKGIEFTVRGKPIQQGSMRAFNNKKTGRAQVVQGGSSEQRKALASWRDACRAAALEALNDRPLFRGPVYISVSFLFDRPKTHYGKGRNEDSVKESAPEFKTTAPDIDKLIRSLLDALTGVVFYDDVQVVGVYANKEYTRSGARTVVFIETNSLPSHPASSE